MKSFAIILFLIGIASINTQAQDEIIGKWKLEQVIVDGVDVSQEHNPFNERWIEFLKNGSFQSDGRPFGKNSGTWSEEKTENIIHLKSKVEDDNSDWVYELDKDKIRWTGFGDRKKQNTVLMHTKIE